MNKRERDGIGGLFEAFTTFDDPVSARFKTAEALRQLAGATWAHIMDVGAVYRTHQFADYSVGEIDNLDVIAKAHSVYTWKNPIWAHIFKTQGKLIRHPSIVGENQWFNCEFFVDYTKRIAGVSDLVSMNAHDNGVNYWCAAFAHPKKNGINRKSMRTLGWVQPYFERGNNNISAWCLHWDKLKTISENTEEAFAVVRLRGKWQSPVLEMATSGASSLLGLCSDGTVRNEYLREFLRVCTQAQGPAGGSILWKARDGRSYRLWTLRRNTSGTILVRFEPAQSGIISADAINRFSQSNKLTHRESEVLMLLARGRGNREIARELRISEFTVRAHVRNIFTKLGVSNRVEAVNMLSKI